MNCNSLSLLNFIYYFKLSLGIMMTIIPVIVIELIFIRVIRNKIKNRKVNTDFIIKQIKTVFYTIVIFFLAYSLNMVVNTPNSVCSMYARKDIINEYKRLQESVNKSDISEDTMIKYMENVLNNDKKDVKVVKLDNKKDDFLKENSTKTLNSVYVKNGVFYYKGYVAGVYNTYSGTNCPSNPLKEGYNNKFGYNNFFYNRLTTFIDEASKNGYKITMSEQGCRSYQTQVNYYRTMTPGRAAPPGWSLHGLGIASDLEFYGSNGYPCPYGRTDKSCPSMGWAHQNASRFGLTFPLLNASYKEDWHIEPISKQKY